MLRESGIINKASINTRSVCRRNPRTIKDPEGVSGKDCRFYRVGRAWVLMFTHNFRGWGGAHL